MSSDEDEFQSAVESDYNDADSGAGSDDFDLLELGETRVESSQIRNPRAASNRSSSPIPGWTYDVFLSFRGKDTRKNFTDHLYHALDGAGIFTFKDDRGLRRGEVIGPELLKAIEESRISIIIFSRSYASSKWCLDELVHIVKCKHEMGRTVVPVFYDVKPSEVRKQTGHFQEAFTQHEEKYKDNSEKVLEWRIAMREVGKISGFPLQNRLESEFIHEIVKEISSKLSPTCPTSVSKFVGMDWRLKELSLNINLGLNDVRFVGICGMGRIGKTTLATVVHSRMSCLFEGSSFLADVRKGHLISLQEKLLSQTLMESSFILRNVDDGSSMIRSRLCHKKVLVIIDDVDNVDQLEKLAGNHDWFGLGSRIIITTRDEHLLIAHGVDAVYKAEGLNHNEALELFSLKAFKNDHPPTDYVMLSRNVVRYADGLPLALKVFGSYLCGRSIDIWKSASERLKEDSGKEIIDRLRISFDGLEETDKKIFLDIAYFFKWRDRDYVTKILDSCNFQPEIGIDVLICKCLITISYDNKLWMHDLLEEMAKKIVQEESPTELGKRSRLQGREEVYHLLTKNLATEAVEGIIHNFSEKEEVPLSAKAFSNMNKLRLLQICNVKLPQGLDLSNELRFLEWHGYPLKSLPSSFHPDEIVAFNLRYSRIQKLWKEIRPLNKLKFINLSHSENLMKMPDFIWIPNLESLILEGCTRLSKLHSSIGVLKRLILLNLKDCKSLTSLPSPIKLKSLEVCILAGCSKLEKFPEIIGEMESLKKLDLSGTAIEQFPRFFFLLMKNVEVLSFCGCKGLRNKSWPVSQLMKIGRPDPMPSKLPSFSGLCCLIELDLSDCNLWEGAIPNDLGSLSSLEKLNLSNNSFVSLPTSISQLLNLSHLYLSNCKRFKSLPVLPSNVAFIQVFNCTSMEITSDALKSLSSYQNRNMFHHSFFGFNCFKLIENEGDSNLILALMKKCFCELGSKKWYYDVVVPGNEIPKWFKHQSERTSTKIESATLFDNSDNEKVIGLVVCCVFVLHEHTPLVHEHAPLGFVSLISCGTCFAGSSLCGESNKLGRAMSDHIWLQFVPLDGNRYTRDFNKNHFKVRLDTMFPDLEVKKFAVRLVYKHEVEEFNQTTNQCSSSSTFENFHDLRQDLDKSALDGARVEKLRDYISKEHYRRFDYRAGVDKIDCRRRKFDISLTNSDFVVWEDL